MSNKISYGGGVIGGSSKKKQQYKSKRMNMVQSAMQSITKPSRSGPKAGAPSSNASGGTVAPEAPKANRPRAGFVHDTMQQILRKGPGPGEKGFGDRPKKYQSTRGKRRLSFAEAYSRRTTDSSRKRVMALYGRTKPPKAYRGKAKFGDPVKRPLGGGKYPVTGGYPTTYPDGTPRGPLQNNPKYP